MLPLLRPPRPAPSMDVIFRRRFRLWAVIALAWLATGMSPLVAAEAPATSDDSPISTRQPGSLAILGPDYPRVFFFRAAENGPARGAVYERWEAEFNRLQGIMGKCLDEEVLGREARNPEFFSRFKQRQPQQVVLLHFNGNARDPRYQTERYFAGHWIYRRATRIVADVPAEAGESTIRVEDVSDFRVATGRYKTANDDLALFGITADGKHDWTHCEQVQLVSVDPQTKSIRVQRGCYGTQPRAFAAGQARAAAHATEGPWGQTNHLMWYYNHSTHCPRDAQGRTCDDLLVEDLAAWFGPGGRLAAFDGIEFDVLFHETQGDTDGDGELDHGVIGGFNGYGIGVIELVRKLRSRLGDDFLIQADGALGPGGVRSQRAWGLLNGIESEGWPNLNQWEMDDWCGGLNRHFFWRDNARPPVFNYINHKWIEGVPGQPGVTRAPQVPFARHRLVFAAGVFTDAMLCYSLPPERDADGRMGIWDEFRCGAAETLGWLGRPLGPAVHLAAAAPDQLAERAADARRFPVTLGREDRETSADEQLWKLADVPVAGDELTVFVTLRAEPRQGYPREMARLVQMELSGGQTRLLERAPSGTGMVLRGEAPRPLARDTGGRVDYRSGVTIGDLTLEAYAIHPPYQDARGAVFWTRDVDVPRDAELSFQLGMGPKSPERSDGVWFEVWAAEWHGGAAEHGAWGEFCRVFEQSTKHHRWLPQRVPLADWAGKRVRLRFVADCGPRDNATTDHGFWGDVKLVAAGATAAEITPAKTFTSWANERAFTSVFYFRDIRSPRVDLRLSVEGGEPVTIDQMTVHAHPATMYRRFERGIVLANPSRQPWTFALSQLSPGVRYQRIPGTAQQDVAVNNGQPVGERVTLGERDALFLMSDPQLDIRPHSR